MAMYVLVSAKILSHHFCGKNKTFISILYWQDKKTSSLPSYRVMMYG